MQKNKKNIWGVFDDLPSRLYILLGVIFLAAHVIFCAYNKEIPATWSGLVAIVLYIAISVVIFFVSSRRMSIYRTEAEASDSQSGSVIAAFRDSVNIPYAIVSETGKVITVNTAMRSALPLRDSFLNLNIADICGEPLDKLLELAAKETSIEENDDSVPLADGELKRIGTIKLGKKRFKVASHPIKFKGHIYYMLVFEDITELCELADKHYAETPVIAYIVLDNLEEIAQYVKVSYRSEANQVDTILKDWAASFGGVLREYDRDKYVLFLSRKALRACERTKFEILDSIREIKIGDENMPITVSMGISTTGDTLAERERIALVALDTALQRGGDQVVIKKDNGFFYFGGKTKSQQKRTKGHSRIIANKLCSTISTSAGLVIMGHSNPDFDSIGACVGIYALARHLGLPAKIVVDTNNENFKSCTKELLKLEEYKDVFVDGVVGLGYYEAGSHLIVVDTNNFDILEAPEIAKQSFNTIVLDHHIKKAEFEHEPLFAYIDPSASSASELVTEIIEQSVPAGFLKKEEANILMSGIMVDTNNFTRTVGARTFAAALYLRNAGASTEVARTYFEEAFDSYRSEALFGADVELFGEQFAITASEGTDSAHDRVAAAKAANKLLTIKNVNAAFALVKIGDTIHISARSNGSVNVQLILEKMGGGGHFDMAGAALEKKTLDEAKTLLMEKIEEFSKENSK